jgi:putative transposase
MSWKATDAVNERMKMMGQYLSQGDSISELARWYGVSRKTVYKWVERYAQAGPAGLEDLSRAPHHHPGAVSPAMAARILAWKAAKPLWGAPKIHAQLLGLADCPSESTVSNILARHGLSRKARRRPQATPSQSPLRHCEAVNQVWCADFKGHFRTGDGRRCDPLTISDGHSRYLLCCRGLGEGTGSRLVQPLFVATFREFGVPEAIRTDNGPPFASTGLGGLSPLSVWWIELGIRLERIEPGQPQQNGRHERMHRTLKEATANPPCRTLRLQQQAFDAFRVEYNHERPHEALGQRPPASLYVPSCRDYPERKPERRGYPEDWAKRTVRPGGRIRWQGQEINISRALCGREIGLQPAGEGRWGVCFESLELGVLDEQKARVEPAQTLQWSEPEQP